MSSFVFNKTADPTSDVAGFAESAIYILWIFANSFATKGDSVMQWAANWLIFSHSFT